MTRAEVDAELKMLHDRWGFCDRQRAAARQDGVEEKIPQAVLRRRAWLHDAKTLHAYDVWMRIPQTERCRRLLEVEKALKAGRRMVA